MSTQSSLEIALSPTSEINVDRIISEMKGSALARSNWEQLISSAPIALKCLGACFMAAGSKDVKHIKVPMIPGATVQRPLDLQTNLVRCSNLGTEAFLTANKEMTEIYQTSGLSENKVYDIIDVLGNSRAAAKQLPTLLQQLQENAQSCYESSQRIDDQFHEWLVFTQQLWEACQSESSLIADEQSKAITEKAIAASRVKDLDKQVESTKKSMEELGKTMDAARVAFTKASDSQPTGWDIVGQQIVGSLGECLTTGLNQAIPALVDNMNPIAKLKAAGSLIGDLKNGKKDKSDGQPSTNGQSTQAITNPATTTAPATVDPAFSYIKKDLYLYDLLKQVVRNSDDDIDWAATTASAPGKDGKDGNSNLTFIEAMLSDSKENLSKQTGGGVATSTYQQVLEDAIKLVGEIIKVAKDAASDLKAVRPKKGSDSVVRWQTSFDTLYKTAISLSIQAQNLPYNPASPGGTLTDPSLQAAKLNAQTTQAQAVLSHAAARLETTAKTLESTAKVYSENAKLLSEQQGSLAAINATLARLTASTIGLEESKEILIQCIGLIIELKARIVDLTNFFGALAAVIKVVSTKLVKGWIENISSAVTSDSTALDKGILKIGAYSLESAERTMIMSGSISIAAYFSFFADIAKAWQDVSGKSIFPGIELAESLSIPGDAEAKMAKLEKWAKTAQENIKNICGHQRKEIQNGMQARVENVRGLIKQLPASTVPQAITDRASEVVKDIEKADIAVLQQEHRESPVQVLATRRRM